MTLFSGPVVIGIDPGPTESAYSVFDGQSVLESATVRNGELILLLPKLLERKPKLIGIEMIASYGMAVGAEVFETCVFIGELKMWFDLWNDHYYDCEEDVKYERFYRKQIVQHICGSVRAKDTNVKVALIDRIGPPHVEKMEPRIGKRGQELKPVKVRVPGPTYGVTGDAWAATAVAVYAYDQIKEESK